MNTDQTPKKKIILWAILFSLGLAIFPAAKWTYEQFYQSDRPVEALSDEVKTAPKVVREETQSNKNQALNKISSDNGLLPELVLIPAGSFDMGEQSQTFIEAVDKSRSKYFGIPGKRVDISKSFYLGKTEVTYEQYYYFIQEQLRSGQQIESPETAGGGRKKQPVVHVKWSDAMAYATWLGAQKELNCRLPTEAEWEYAARAQTQTAYPWGDDRGNNNANCSACGSQWDNKQAAPVAQFRANKFGLYDMSGNVFEWTCSNWRDQFDGSEQQCNGDVDDAQFRVLRGGSWGYDPDSVRASARFNRHPDNRNNILGFRVLCSSPIK